MGLGNHLSGLRCRKDVLTHNAYTQRLVGRLVCLFRSRKVILFTSIQRPEELMRPDP